MIHGLLQTTDYALTVLRELRPKDSDEQIRRVVDLRMERQRLLDQDPPLDAWIILDEGAISGASAVPRSCGASSSTWCRPAGGPT